MRTYAWMPLAAALVSCNKVGFDAVSISPIYSYVEGCNAVRVSGHGFAEDISVTVSMPDASGVAVTADLESLVLAKDDPAVTDPDLKALNVGFYVLGVMPGAPAGTSGYADINVTSDGVTASLPQAYYYVACPADALVEGYGPSSGVTAGSDVSLQGCNLDAATMQVQLLDETGAPVGQQVPLVSDCRTAAVHFAAPAQPDGTYYVTLVDAKGNVLAGEPCGLQDSATYYCTDYPITYGGAK